MYPRGLLCSPIHFLRAGALPNNNQFPRRIPNIFLAYQDRPNVSSLIALLRLHHHLSFTILSENQRRRGEGLIDQQIYPKNHFILTNAPQINNVKIRTYSISKTNWHSSDDLTLINYTQFLTLSQRICPFGFGCPQGNNG